MSKFVFTPNELARNLFKLTEDTYVGASVPCLMKQVFLEHGKPRHISHHKPIGVSDLNNAPWDIPCQVLLSPSETGHKDWVWATIGMLKPLP